MSFSRTSPGRGASPTSRNAAARRTTPGRGPGAGAVRPAGGRRSWASAWSDCCSSTPRCSGVVRHPRPQATDVDCSRSARSVLEQRGRRAQGTGKPRRPGAAHGHGAQHQPGVPAAVRRRRFSVTRCRRRPRRPPSPSRTERPPSPAVDTGEGPHAGRPCAPPRRSTQPSTAAPRGRQSRRRPARRGSRPAAKKAGRRRKAGGTEDVAPQQRRRQRRGRVRDDAAVGIGRRRTARRAASRKQATTSRPPKHADPAPVRKPGHGPAARGPAAGAAAEATAAAPVPARARPAGGSGSGSSSSRS